MRDTTRVIREQIPPPAARLVPCTVVAVSPLTVSWGGGTVLAAVVPGFSHTTGPAIALVQPGLAPVVLPNL